MRVFTVLLALIGSTVASSWPEDVCPPEQEHDWSIEKLLRHEDCNKFYKCTFGQPVEQLCPAGLLFCLINWRCEWPELVDCEDRNVPIDTTTTTTNPNTTITTTTTPNITITTTITPNTTITTVTPNTTTTTPAPTTTTTTPNTTITTTATPNTATTTQAPTTTTTTPEPTTTSTTPAPTITTTTATPEPTTTTTVPGFRANGCPINVSEHWLLPHETECNLFYYCVWGNRVLRNCPTNLHFNRVIQVCDWPGAAGCNVQ